MPPKGKGKKSKKQLEEEKRKFESVVYHFRRFNKIFACTGIAEEEKRA